MTFSCSYFCIFFGSTLAWLSDAVWAARCTGFLTTSQQDGLLRGNASLPAVPLQRRSLCKFSCVSVFDFCAFLLSRSGFGSTQSLLQLKKVGLGGGIDGARRSLEPLLLPKGGEEGDRDEELKNWWWKISRSRSRAKCNLCCQVGLHRFLKSFVKHDNSTEWWAVVFANSYKIIPKRSFPNWQFAC